MHRMTSMSFVTIIRTEADNEYPKTETVLAAMAAMPVMQVSVFYIYSDNSGAQHRYDVHVLCTVVLLMFFFYHNWCVIAMEVMPVL